MVNLISDLLKHSRGGELCELRGVYGAGKRLSVDKQVSLKLN